MGKFSWNQPICNEDWFRRDYDREPHRLSPAQLEVCAFCGAPTTSGIYVRIDPSTVPFPQEEDG
jgi:hypothetical protein